jgi:glycosyltransferase involved in cell wall biosynthesis
MDFTIRYFTPEQFMAVYFKPTKIEYDIFFTIGNSKYPMMYSMGLYNIYMCQFPFDLYKPPKDFERGRWAYYDIILVNSRFSFDWYLRSIQRDAIRYLNSNSYFPALAILHPPVDPFRPPQSFERLPSLPDKSRITNIAVVGRFFKGRQNKGHGTALSIIQEIVKQSKRPVHLYLCGYVHPDEASHKYIDELKTQITTKKLPATIIANADGSDIAKILESATIFWHLTGVNYLAHPKDDPASFEHFGIAIIEAMFMGLIPMVTSVGGMRFKISSIISLSHNFTSFRTSRYCKKWC